jgi:hypothetical protein
MTNIPPISDGQPLTYETLNLMIAAINKLSKTEAAENQVIEVSGGGTNPSTDDASIVVGEFTLNFGKISSGKQSTAQATVNLGGKFKKIPRIVVTAIDEKSGEKQISYVSLIVTGVSRTQFTCKGRRMVAGKDVESGDELKVNFVAIGAAP